MAKAQTAPTTVYVPAPSSTPALGTVATVIIGGGILYLGYQALQALDLVEDKSDKDSAKYEALMKKFIEPTYGDTVLAAWKKLGGKDGGKQWWAIPSIKLGNDAKALAQRIWDAKGFFNDDEEKLNSVFRELQYGLDIWKVNKAFKAFHDNRNIFDYIQDFTNEEERATLYDIIKDFKDAPKP